MRKHQPEHRDGLPRTMSGSEESYPRVPSSKSSASRELAATMAHTPEPLLPSPGERASQAGRGDSQLLLEIDLDTFTVRSASVSISFLAGCPLGELMNPQSQRLFRQVRPQLAVLERAGRLGDMVFNFGFLDLHFGAWASLDDLGGSVASGCMATDSNPGAFPARPKTPSRPFPRAPGFVGWPCGAPLLHGPGPAGKRELLARRGPVRLPVPAHPAQVWDYQVGQQVLEEASPAVLLLLQSFAWLLENRPELQVVLKLDIEAHVSLPALIQQVSQRGHQTSLLGRMVENFPVTVGATEQDCETCEIPQEVERFCLEMIRVSMSGMDLRGCVHIASQCCAGIEGEACGQQLESCTRPARRRGMETVLYLGTAFAPPFPEPAAWALGREAVSFVVDNLEDLKVRLAVPEILLGFWLAPLEEPLCAAGASLLQRAAKTSASALDGEANSDALATEMPPPTMESDKMLPSMLMILALLAFGPQVLEPIASCISGWLFMMRSMGEKNGLPESQRFCQDEVQKDFENWLDVIPDNSEPLIREVGNREPLTYNQLHSFAKDQEVWLSRFGIGLSDRVCTMIPNGPEAAVCFLVFPLRCVFAPLNPAFTAPEIEFEFQDLPCHTVVVMKGEDNSATLQVAAAQKVQVLEMAASSTTAGLFTLALHPQSPVNLSARRTPSTETRSARKDVALVLHTSGTTKKPKIVPLTHENLTVGALCIKSTLQRKPEDVCLNLMPLYHIHGLSVNVLATAMSGASVICSPGYRGPDKPAEWLSSGAANWYSAVPTMHQGIVEAALSSDDFNAETAGVGLIRNCSAALVPVLANKMEQLFRCVVMPTYAMSESMPIASNPLPPHLRVLRSVGQAAGPGMALRHEGSDATVQPGEEAEVCVRGACVTKGYEMRAHMDQDPNIEAFTPDGWLRTGDKGYIDENNYLCLSGRYKEIINRGGEKISPFEVENVCRQWPAVFDCIAFSCPHVQLGETVGLAAVLREGEKITGTRLEELRSFAAEKMSEKWLPQTILFMKDIPKGSTGKPARIGLAKRMNLEPLDIDQPNQVTVWDATSGLPVPVDEAAKKATAKKAVDSLGRVRDVNDAKDQELALIESMYGFAIPWILFFHMFLYTFDYSYGDAAGDYTAPFRKEQDPWMIGLRLGYSMKPVTLFLLCYGYLEAQDRNFQFGGFERELVIGLLIITVNVLSSLFKTFLEFLVGRATPQDLPKDSIFEAFYPQNLLFHKGGWFLECIFFGRIILVLCHKLRIPGYLQILVALCVAAWQPPRMLEPRQSVSALSLAYVMLAGGAYVAPVFVRRFGTMKPSLALRTAAAGYLALCCCSPKATSFSDASRMPCLEQTLLPVTVCLPFSMAQQALWVAAVAVLLAPQVGFLRQLGRYALGAFLFGGTTWMFLRDYGVTLGGVTLLPSLGQVSQAFKGHPGDVGLTVGYILFLLAVIYCTCFFTGLVFHTFVGSMGNSEADVEMGDGWRLSQVSLHTDDIPATASISVFVISAIIGVSIYNLTASDASLLYHARESILDLATSKGNLIAAELRKASSCVLALDTMVTFDAWGKTLQQFDSVAKGLMQMCRSASELQLAPSGKILYLYPMTEEALGLDMLLNPQSGRASYNSIRQQETRLVGPVELVEGGFGLLVIRPIFSPVAPERLPDAWYVFGGVNYTRNCSAQSTELCHFPGPELGGQPSFFWGFGLSLSRLEDILQVVNLKGLENGAHRVAGVSRFAYELSSEVNGQRLTWQRSSDPEPLIQPVEVTVGLEEYGFEYLLKVAPMGGWPVVSDDFWRQLLLV
ncbi:unnamed protein product [Effrenium voratum]|nr:unnamed protein product [Effrenium voratum]